MVTTTTIELSPSELKGLCQRYLREDVSQSKHSLSRKSTIRVLNYTLKPTSDAPSGFLGLHLFLHVTIVAHSNNGAEETVQLKFFSKSAPNAVASRMEYLEEFGVFKKETVVYKKILSVLQQIYPNIAPKCYYAENNLLVFENLVDKSFRMAAGRDGILDLPHLKCALGTLAAMHASSLIYERKQGQRLPDICPEAVAENAYPADITEEHVRHQNFYNGVEVIKKLVTFIPKYNESMDKVLDELPKKMAVIFQLAKTSTKYVNVFTHGDLWANNCMFKYDEAGEIPIECRFVDFQLARYAPVMMDLITILTIPTSSDFRSQHLTELLNDYYTFLSANLKSHGIEIEAIMPKHQFEESVAEFRIVGLIESLLFTHLTILPPESTQTLTGTDDGFTDFFKRKRIEICVNAFYTDFIYRQRLTDTITDLVDNFILKS